MKNNFKLSLLALSFLLMSSIVFGSESAELISALQSYSPSKKKVTFTKIEKNKGDTALVAWTEDHIYLAVRKNSKEKWKFIDSAANENIQSLYFPANQELTINLAEGGTSHSETTTKWRIEGEVLKVIGQDSIAYSGWNFGKLVISVNYLSGKKVATIEAQDIKKKTSICKFDTKKYSKLKLSDIGAEGVDEPVCGKTF